MTLSTDVLDGRIQDSVRLFGLWVVVKGKLVLMRRGVSLLFLLLLLLLRHCVSRVKRRKRETRCSTAMAVRRDENADGWMDGGFERTFFCTVEVNVTKSTRGVHPVSQRDFAISPSPFFSSAPV